MQAIFFMKILCTLKSQFSGQNLVKFHPKKINGEDCSPQSEGSNQFITCNKETQPTQGSFPLGHFEHRSCLVTFHYMSAPSYHHCHLIALEEEALTKVQSYQSCEVMEDDKYRAQVPWNGRMTFVILHCGNICSFESSLQCWYLLIELCQQ